MDTICCSAECVIFCVKKCHLGEIVDLDGIVTRKFS